jgi:hypothetical protein
VIEDGVMDTESPEIAGRQERAASRLLDDERLRGDLTDDEFQPLLDWALAAADRIVAETAGQSDEQAAPRVERGLGVIRESVQAAGDAIAAHAEHDASRLRSALAALGLGAGDQRADAAMLRQLLDRKLAGPEIAALIARRLTTSLDTAPTATERSSP